MSPSAADPCEVARRRGRSVSRAFPQGAAAVRGQLEVAIANPSRYGGLGLRRLRRWLTALVRERSAALLEAEVDVSFSVQLASDRQVRRLNATFRGRDETTDVLSFPGEATPEGLHLGDVVVSVPAARRQAAGLGRSLNQELATLLLHGLLHCQGYDHETDDGAMDRLERRLRRKWVDDEW